MLRRRDLLALPISLVCGLPEGTWAQAKPENPSLRVTVGGRAFLQYAPLTIAEQLGYFNEAGLAPQIIDVAGGAKALEALVGGSAELTAGAFDHTIQMQAKNQEIVGVVLFGRHPTFALAVRSERADAYHDPKDLRGMRIGVTALGSQTQFMIEYIAIQVGLAPSEISFVSVGGGTGAVAAIRNGAVDAVVTGEPALTELTSSGDTKIVADTRTSEGTISVFGGLYPSGTIYARAGFIDRNPQTIEAFVLAMVRALRWINQASVEEIADLLPRDWAKPNRDLFLTSIRGTRDMFSPEGRFSLDEARVALHVLSTIDPRLRNVNINLEATFTNAFVDKARATLGGKR
ncbi:MAG: ABC transporter substrate-binding protein [Bradyrhizobium sp.]|uniref:ABC transporter substrate-binding protein n=1 Tax=Bradyrhizobium sp. TaxID=376 RepID=UPI001DB466D5|nr:ABC transporter substrate-binding protein [Bradyrhizobium sp.]MBV9564854.1 ABC transporter substrate-binding protein [Bradyrhizobium sp.]